MYREHSLISKLQMQEEDGLSARSKLAPVMSTENLFTNSIVAKTDREKNKHMPTNRIAMFCTYVLNANNNNKHSHDY